MTIEKKETEFICYKCSGKGIITLNKIPEHKLDNLPNQIKCDVCNGTGKFKDPTYYFIDDKTGICFDSDTLA